MVKTYIKKPVAVRAVQYDGTNFAELAEFSKNEAYLQDGIPYVHTLEGEMRMKNKIGDYLIQGIQGEFYFCEKSVFEQTYDEERLF